jgi:hypothetical protein
VKNWKMAPIILILCLILPFSLLAQDKPSTEQKIVRAIRTEEPITIDGVLEEQIWQMEGYSDFVQMALLPQKKPKFGSPSTIKTSMWLPGCTILNRKRSSDVSEDETILWIRIGSYLLWIPIMTAEQGINLE